MDNATPTGNTPDERQENPATACERDCVNKLTKANNLSRFETAEAWRIWSEVGKQLALALEKRWSMDTVLAMHILLHANLLALSTDKTDETPEVLHLLYQHAIMTAAQQGDELYVLRAKRAYAAVLAYHGQQSEALRLLLRVRRSLARMEAKGLYHKEDDLWLQTTMQLAEVCWQMGGVDRAFRLMSSIHYPEQLNMYHVAARILHARLLWHPHKGQTFGLRRVYRRLAARMGRQAARDVYRVDSYCHSSSVRRAQRLRLPWGLWWYGRAYKKELVCPFL